MCAGIEYLRDGERVCVYFGSPRVELPVRRRDGGISFFRWGALRACYYADDNIRRREAIPGRALRASRRYPREEVGEL